LVLFGLVNMILIQYITKMKLYFIMVQVG
jgi:hypothetical protein